MPSHVERDAGGHCGVCGMYLRQNEENLNVLNFERFKWGGVRHDQVVYAAFDLGLFLLEPAVQPVAEDVTIFRSLINTIRTVPIETTSAGLQAHFAKSFKSNKAERDILVGLLGFCGILGTPEHLGYSEYFVPSCDRHLPDQLSRQIAKFSTVAKLTHARYGTISQGRQADQGMAFRRRSIQTSATTYSNEFEIYSSWTTCFKTLRLGVLA